jgi:hypothetical protein
MIDDARVAQENSHEDLYPINTLAAPSRRAHVVGSEKAGTHYELQPSLAKSTELSAASISKHEAATATGSSSVDARIKLLAQTLRSTGRIPQVRPCAYVF